MKEIGYASYYYRHNTTAGVENIEFTVSPFAGSLIMYAKKVDYGRDINKDYPSNVSHDKMVYGELGFVQFADQPSNSHLQYHVSLYPQNNISFLEYSIVGYAATDHIHLQHGNPV